MSHIRISSNCLQTVTAFSRIKYMIRLIMTCRKLYLEFSRLRQTYQMTMYTQKTLWMQILLRKNIKGESLHGIESVYDQISSKQIQNHVCFFFYILFYEFVGSSVSSQCCIGQHQRVESTSNCVGQSRDGHSATTRVSNGTIMGHIYDAGRSTFYGVTSYSTRKVSFIFFL